MKKLFVELADTAIKREYGLKNRHYLHRNAGMLFKFPYCYRLGFWMQDTYLPLDIAFLSDEGKILQISQMVPMSTRPVIASKPCRYALEVNKNWFKDNEIEVGATIGGEYIGKKKLLAQTMPMLDQMPPQDDILMPEVLTPEQFQEPQQIQNEEEPVNPDVYLNRTFKEVLENAQIRDQDLIIVYQKKDGYMLPPKRVSPPYEFWTDADGRRESIVNLWDNQDGGWKSFIIDNIIDIEIVE